MGCALLSCGVCFVCQGAHRAMAARGRLMTWGSPACCHPFAAACGTTRAFPLPSCLPQGLASYARADVGPPDMDAFLKASCTLELHLACKRRRLHLCMDAAQRCMLHLCMQAAQRAGAYCGVPPAHACRAPPPWPCATSQPSCKTASRPATSSCSAAASTTPQPSLWPLLPSAPRATSRCRWAGHAGPARRGVLGGV